MGVIFRQRHGANLWLANDEAYSFIKGVANQKS